MIGAAYIRVSTDSQLDYSPESQLDEILHYANTHDITIPQEYIFIEKEGISAKSAENRFAFQQMISIAKQKPKPFAIILVWKFSRFARNQDESTFYKGILRKKYDIDIVSVSEPIISGIYGRLIEMIIEWQDEFYSYNLGMEVRRGMKKKAEKGLYNGPMPLGYQKNPNEFPIIVESEALIVKLIYELFVGGYSKNAIVKHLNYAGLRTKTNHRFSFEAVSYILQNPFYIGKIRWNRRNSSSDTALKDESEWIISEAHHLPIIDDSTWIKTQKLLLSHTAPASKPLYSSSTHWLSGIVKCSICGKSLSIKRGKNNYFQCLGYQHGLHKESQNISEKKLELAILSSLKHVLPSTQSHSPITPLCYSKTEYACYKEELDKMHIRKKRAESAYLNGIDSLEEYQLSKKEILHSIVCLEKKLETLRVSDSAISSHFQNLLSLLENKSTPAKLRAFALRNIVEKIVYCKETQSLTIHYFLSQTTVTCI